MEIAGNQRIEALRGSAPVQRVTAGVVAAQTRNSRCALLTLANAAGVSMDRMMQGTPWQMPFGQARSAIVRGETFERRVKADGYAILLDLIRSALKVRLEKPRIEDLHTRFPFDRRERYRSLEERSAETKRLVGVWLDTADKAPNLIDGAVLTVTLAGRRGFLEADAIALSVGGPLRVGEVKSFPVVDDRADPEKVGAAADQTAVYVMALQDLVLSLGGSAAQVSSEILLVTPKNTGMQAVVHSLDVKRRVAHHRRQLAMAGAGVLLAERVPAGVSFPAAKDPDAPAKLDRLRDAVGHHYEPSCLSFCGLARYCRDRVRTSGNPACVDSSILRVLPGVASLTRALELAEGSPPKAGEEPAAELLRRAYRVVGKTSGNGGP